MCPAQYTHSLSWDGCLIRRISLLTMTSGITGSQWQVYASAQRRTTPQNAQPMHTRVGPVGNSSKQERTRSFTRLRDNHLSSLEFPKEATAVFPRPWSPEGEGGLVLGHATRNAFHFVLGKATLLFWVCRAVRRCMKVLYKHQRQKKRNGCSQDVEFELCVRC